MEKFIIKTMLMAFCLAFIPSIRSSAFNPNGLRKACEAAKKSSARIEEITAKLQKANKQNNLNKLQQTAPAREALSNGYSPAVGRAVYTADRAVHTATRSFTCDHCHGLGYIVVQGTRMSCGICKGKGRKILAMNAVPNAVEKPSEPFWKSTWFVVACCGALVLGAGYCFGKAS